MAVDERYAANLTRTYTVGTPAARQRTLSPEILSFNIRPATSFDGYDVLRHFDIVPVT